jgi:hypothetical protein
LIPQILISTFLVLVLATGCQGETNQGSDQVKDPEGDSATDPSLQPSGSDPEGTPAGASGGSTGAVSIGKAPVINCSFSRAEMNEKATVKVESANTAIFAGYQQVAANNQNPIVARFEGDTQTWCRSDYETSGDDGTAYGLIWDGANELYAAFSATGTQGDASSDYRRFTQSGWLTGYGNGGGAKVTVLLKLDTSDGSPVAGTYLRSQKSDGKTNSLVITGLAFVEDAEIQVLSDAWFSPLATDKAPLSCSGSSPFDYELIFDRALSKPRRASATNCR